MYLVPVLLAVDVATATDASVIAAAEVRARALHVERPRRLDPAAAALAVFELRLYADGIELPAAA